MVEVRRAGAADVDAVAATMHEAFRHDAISSWLFPDEEGRERLHPGFMRMFVELALVEGEVYLTPGALGVAVWFPVDPAQHGESDFTERVAAYCGPYAPRFRLLDQAMSTHHPGSEAHMYLNFLAVRPAYQGQGLGTALLRDRLRRADQAGEPAYLEASSPRSATLYAREGFDRHATYDLPDGGPTLIPMWRKPIG